MVLLCEIQLFRSPLPSVHLISATFRCIILSLWAVSTFSCTSFLAVCTYRHIFYLYLWHDCCWCVLFCCILINVKTWDLNKVYTCDVAFACYFRHVLVISSTIDWLINQKHNKAQFWRVLPRGIRNERTSSNSLPRGTHGIRFCQWLRDPYFGEELRTV